MQKTSTLMLLLILIAGCAPPVIPTDVSTPLLSPPTTAPVLGQIPTTAAEIPSTPLYQPLTLSVLKNAQYHSPDWGDFQLVDGVFYRTPPTPNDSPQTYLTQIDERVAFGDLNADGIEDAAVFLQTQNGGTGHFVELAAVLNQAGSAYNISTVYLGDRVGVESTQIASGIIILDMRVHGPNEPLASASQPETWRFHLENGQLIRLP